MGDEIHPLLEDFEDSEERTAFNQRNCRNTSHQSHTEASEAQASFDRISVLSDDEDGHSTDLKTRDEIYDIFISHASDDIEEVKILCAELEDRYGFKCMLADRDFDAGVPVENNLKLKMEKSRRILMIITPSFVESFWCKSEMMKAFMMMASGRKNLIIPVVLKPVDTEMPAILEYYTYIDALKVDDLSYKIFETFYNPKIVDKADSIRQQVFHLTHEEIRNKNGARLMTRRCRKAQKSCRGVAWTFPPIDDSAYEPYDILQIYDEARDILNNSFAFRWYGIMFNTRRQIVIGIVTFILSFLILPVILDVEVLSSGLVNFPIGLWLLIVYVVIAFVGTLTVSVGINIIGKKALAIVERKIFDNCLRYRRETAVLALVRDESRNSRCFSRPVSLVLIRYSLEQCENFVFEFLKAEGKSTQPPVKEFVDRTVQNFTFNIRQFLVYWDEMPDADVDRHNTWTQKQCVCELFVSSYNHKKEKENAKIF